MKMLIATSALALVAAACSQESSEMPADYAEPVESSTDRPEMDVETAEIATMTEAEAELPVTISMTIDNIDADAGKVYIALQSREDFAKNAGNFTKVVEGDAERKDVMIEDVTPGTYAVAVFQDTDGNGELTMKNMRPSEPYGFSGDVEGRPTFANAMIELGEDMETRITLKG
ncbi:DUF2141 domain-containing protein [Parvularcula sp. ZS-1/3]|uniref:DUF2141 domain-containing protein n=1 Tax=Parvularcula mediterranea TaxID=2732508 RepID=A0A7Y3RKS7_9PROT|nr:DUF2141 domain-containing protein [Parvularcula mediterranea]NNU15888.1 DUF2141 domain-containing protein [Parvularcula mediterranea]